MFGKLKTGLSSRIYRLGGQVANGIAHQPGSKPTRSIVADANASYFVYCIVLNKLDRFAQNPCI